MHLRTQAFFVLVHSVTICVIGVIAVGVYAMTNACVGLGVGLDVLTKGMLFAVVDGHDVSDAA